MDLCSVLEAASGLFDISKGSEFRHINPSSFRNRPNENGFLPLLKSSKCLCTPLYITLFPALPSSQGKQLLLEEAVGLGPGLLWELLQLLGIQRWCFYYICLWVLCVPFTLWLVLTGKHVSPGDCHMKIMEHSCEERTNPHIPVKKCVRGHWLELILALVSWAKLSHSW